MMCFCILALFAFSFPEIKSDKLDLFKKERMRQNQFHAIKISSLSQIEINLFS